MVTGRMTEVKSFEIGEAIHDSVCKNGYGIDAFVGSTLINVYGNRGDIVDVLKVFSHMPICTRWAVGKRSTAVHTQRLRREATQQTPSSELYS